MARNAPLGDAQALRIAQLAVRLHERELVTRPYIQERYNVSRATATRDMSALEQSLPVVRRVRGGLEWMK
jgi:DeoR/GlpR family transcriptional regulator of sugar metabolism